MRALIFASALLFGSIANAQNPRSAPAAIDSSHQATPEQIREYFTLVHLDAQMKNVMSSMVKGMKGTAPSYIPVDFWQDMNDTMNSYDFLSELVPIYQKHFTREDMVSVLAFYHSPAGEHLLTNQEVMTAEAQTAFRAIGQRLGEQVGERHADELAAAKKKYEDGIAARQNLNLSPDPK